MGQMFEVTGRTSIYWKTEVYADNEDEAHRLAEFNWFDSTWHNEDVEVDDVVVLDGI